jgi:hypothetical protein
MNLESKYKKLKDILIELKSAVVAYSGGVDRCYYCKKEFGFKYVTLD